MAFKYTGWILGNKIKKKINWNLTTSYLTYKAVTPLEINRFFYTQISDWSDCLKDIFTDMQAKIGCPYLSDLPYYKRAVWFEIKRLCLSDYPKKQLEDFSRYVFGVPYAVIQEALQRKDVMKHGRNACAD